MLCPNCGKDVGDSLSLCDECQAAKKVEEPSIFDDELDEEAPDADIDVDAESAIDEEPVAETVEPVSTDRPAGFWLRFFAYLIDGGIISIVSFVLSSIIFEPILGLLEDVFMGPQGLVGNDLALTASAVIVTLLGAIIVYIMIGWLYFALMESSKYRATLGKLALGLVVTDLDGQSVTFGRASGRHFGKIVSAIAIIGYFLAAFTRRKQALHDMIASCLVVKEKELGTGRLVGTCIFAVIFSGATSGLNQTGSEEDYAALSALGNSVNQNYSSPTQTTPAVPYQPPKLDYTVRPPVGGSSFSFNSNDYVSTIAIREKNNNKITIGFFEEHVGEPEIKRIRSESALGASRVGAPPLELELWMVDGASQIGYGTFESFRLTALIDGERVQLDRQKTKPETFRNLTGILGNNGALYTAFDHKQEFGDDPMRSATFSLNIQARLFEVDPMLSSAALDGDAGDGPGFLVVGENRVQFKSAFGLYSPRYNRLEIGFFRVELSEPERAELQKKGSLFAFVNNKRANLVLSMTMMKGKRKISLKTLREYDIYVLRDTFSDFTFPGQYDRRRFGRVGQDVENGELDIKTQLVMGRKNIKGALKGSDISYSTKFSWNVKFDAPIVEIP